MRCGPLAPPRQWSECMCWCGCRWAVFVCSETEYGVDTVVTVNWDRFYTFIPWNNACLFLISFGHCFYSHMTAHSFTLNINDIMNTPPTQIVDAMLITKMTACRGTTPSLTASGDPPPRSRSCSSTLLETVRQILCAWFKRASCASVHRDRQTGEMNVRASWYMMKRIAYIKTGV